MKTLLEQDIFVLYAASKIENITPSQLTRFLFESGIFEKGFSEKGFSKGFDLQECLANLKEAGHFKQSVSSNGITYELTKEGRDALGANLSLVPENKIRELDEKSIEFSRIFAIEEDYPAQYTESANAIVPVFLSIREGAKILMKVSIIVQDTETAKEITRNWSKNARDTYRAIWDCIGQGKPFPEFTPY